MRRGSSLRLWHPFRVRPFCTPPFSRIDHSSVTIGGKPIDKSRQYSVVTKTYLAKGKDGYDVFAEGKVLVDEEELPPLNTLVRNYFTKLKVLKKMSTVSSDDAHINHSGSARLAHRWVMNHHAPKFDAKVDGRITQQQRQQRGMRRGSSSTW